MTAPHSIVKNMPAAYRHQEGADLWACPCLECTALDHSATDTHLSLREYRAQQFPEVYA